MEELLKIRGEVEKIRAAVDGIEIKGSGNRLLATYAFDKCSEVIKMVNQLNTKCEELKRDDQDDC